MASFEFSRPQRLRRRASGLVGWFLVLGVAGVAACCAIATQTEPGDDSPAPEQPAAEIARDDHQTLVWSLAFSPGGDRLASATISGEVAIKDLATTQVTHVRRGPMGSARSVAFTPDGRALAVAGGSSAIWLWDLEAAAELPALEVGGEESRCLAFSPDGALLAVGGLEGTVTLWDWRARQRLASWASHQGSINALSFSSNGSRLISGDSHGLITLWDVASRRERMRLQAHRKGVAVTAAIFAPDGALFATSALLDRVVRLWDGKTGEPRGTIPAPAFGVNALQFSTDGTMLALAQGDGTASVWDAARRREIGSVHAGGGSLQSVAFSNDGRRLATGGIDGALHLWDLTRVLAPNQTLAMRP